MIALMLLLCALGQPEIQEEEHDTFSPGFRFGPCFIASFPSMQDEKDFAGMNSEAGLELDLGTVAWGGSIEFLGDIGRKVRVRGSVGVLRLHGAYEDEYDPLSYILLGICTGGIGFLFGPEEEVVDLDDQALSIEAQAYYVLTRGSSVSLSIGAGPVYTSVRRQLDSPNTSTLGKGNGLGLVTSIRVDQESSTTLGCIPLKFALEAGYRFNSVTLDGEEADGFTLDFSGPVLKVGSYLGF